MSPTSAHVLSRHLRRGLCGGLFVLISLAPLRADVVTYSVPFNGLSAITAGPDGALWFGGNNHIGRVTTSGVVTQFSVPTPNTVVNFITAGPDGALWFTENELNSGVYFSKIGRITTAGAVTEFPLANTMAFPGAITTGPDGALWFAEQGDNKIGRITTSGVITEYTVPKGGGYIFGITTGPDGAIWFTNGDSTFIGRITMAGEVTEYPLPRPSSYTGGIAAGPDGALWFAELDGRIGRITPSGAISEFLVPTVGSSPLGLALGPDGLLWFTENTAVKIGSISTSGAFAETPVPGVSSGFLAFITAGPDGAMWFTVVGGKVGRITTSATAVPATLVATPPSLTVTQVVNGPSIVQNISITAATSATHANISGVTSGGNAWDSVTPATGPTPTTISVEFKPGNLPAQTYHDTISVMSDATNSPLQIPVTLNVVASIPNPTNVYYFSHLAFSGGYQTTLTYVNYSPQAVTCVTNFYSDTGSPLSVPFRSGTTFTRTDVLQAGQSFHDQTVADLAPPFVVGWAKASCTGPVEASLLFRYYQSGVAAGEAGINAETTPATKFVTFAETFTGVAYANPSTTQSANVTIAVYNAGGTLLGNTSFPLGPLAHGAANLGPLLGLSSFTGFVKVTSTIPILSLSLNFEAFPVFSSLPPGDLPSSTPLVGSGATGPAPLPQNYYLSHLAFSGGYQMTLTYVNYSPQAVTCVTNFYSDTGSALPVPFRSGTNSTRTDVLQAGQSFHDQTVADLAPPFVVGWAKASCTGPVQASLLFRYYQSGVAAGEAGINAETTPATEFVTFAETYTGLVYANPSTTQSANVTIAVYSSAGAQLGSTSIPLAPLAHGAANLGPLLGLSSFTGFVKVTSAIPILSFSVNFEAFPVFSSLPPGDLPTGTAIVP